MEAREKFLMDLRQADGIVYAIERHALGGALRRNAIVLIGMMEATYETLFGEKPPIQRDPLYQGGTDERT